MKKLLIFSALLVIFISISSQASGTLITFSDDSKFWPGWGNGTGEDGIDCLGIPNFTGGTVIIEGGYLKSIQFTYKADAGENLNIWSLLKPSDLFIDRGADSTWDSVVKTNGQVNAGSYPVYSINLSAEKGKNDSAYLLTGADNSGSWVGYDIRNGHPLAVKECTDREGYVDFSGWKTPGHTEEEISSLFDFSGLNQGKGFTIGSEDFTVAWTVSCANDVVYAKITNPAPEPATLLLLVIGFIGLVALQRKRSFFSKKEVR
jgi:hypothetical protein